MKKTAYPALFIAILITFSACGSKYIVDISDMPQEQKEHHEQELNEALENYNNAETTEEKMSFASTIGFTYLTLGKYSDAIPYYEEILENDPVNYQALTNLSYMYEEVDEVEKALEYTQILWENYYYRMVEVNSDYVRLLLKNNQPEEAKNAVNTFVETDLGKENQEFAKDLYEKIAK